MRILIVILLILFLSSCKFEETQSIEPKISIVKKCTKDQIEYEVNQLIKNKYFMLRFFYLDENELLQFLGESSQIKRNQREQIMIKFISQLNSNEIEIIECNSKRKMEIRISTLALYCLAKIEKLPFSRATGFQNCTEPWFSDEIFLPENIFNYQEYDRSLLLYNYLSYFISEQRRSYFIENGYD